jgi:hypothetical protein
MSERRSPWTLKGAEESRPLSHIAARGVLARFGAERHHRAKGRVHRARGPRTPPHPQTVRIATQRPPQARHLFGGTQEHSRSAGEQVALGAARAFTKLETQWDRADRGLYSTNDYNRSKDTRERICKARRLLLAVLAARSFSWLRSILAALKATRRDHCGTGNPTGTFLPNSRTLRCPI